MTPTLIVLSLLALGVAIVAIATRQTASRPYEQRKEQDTAWGEPSTPAEQTADPFAHAPLPQAANELSREPERQA
jgi:hypothetical protein